MDGEKWWNSPIVTVFIIRSFQLYFNVIKLHLAVNHMQSVECWYYWSEFVMLRGIILNLILLQISKHFNNCLHFFIWKYRRYFYENSFWAHKKYRTSLPNTSILRMRLESPEFVSRRRQINICFESPMIPVNVASIIKVSGAIPAESLYCKSVNSYYFCTKITQLTQP